MIDLLKTMIEASKAATLPLDMMITYYQSDCCCLCADVAVFENPSCSDVYTLNNIANDFAFILDRKSIGFLGGIHVSGSIYSETSVLRHEYAEESNVFTKEELKHPHLTTDHSDRAIAIDYIEMVIRKCEERLGE